jgi:hypothetical protein
MEAHKMTAAPGAEQVFRPAGRAFFVYYVAMALCFFGPPLNPRVGVPIWAGWLLGLTLVAAVVYFRWGQEYRLTDRGVVKIWRWPDRRQEIPWEQVGEVRVLRGFTQSLLLVGNLLIKDKAGTAEMFWFGLTDPKGVQALIEGRRP